jgi:hypothetical protein
MGDIRRDGVEAQAEGLKQASPATVFFVERDFFCGARLQCATYPQSP